jgi:hypothetical protein
MFNLLPINGHSMNKLVEINFHLIILADSKAFLQWHKTLGIAAVLDYVHHLLFLNTRKHNVLETGIQLWLKKKWECNS